jgi:hypothetical protein
MIRSSATSFLLAGLLLAGAVWSYARASRTRKWPAVRAAVEACSEVGYYRILAGQPSSAHVVYEVTARYAVAGREHRVELRLASPPGDSVELRYNPRDPAEFAVGTQARWPALLLLAMALLFLTTGAAL